MKPAAGLTYYSFVTGTRIVNWTVQPVLHVHAGLRTFENEVCHRSANVGPAGLLALIPINVFRPRICRRERLSALSSQHRGGELVTAITGAGKWRRLNFGKATLLYIHDPPLKTKNPALGRADRQYSCNAMGVRYWMIRPTSVQK